MPYMNKRQLYSFEKHAFLSGMSFGYGVNHCNLDGEEIMWQFYKGEISEEEWEKALSNKDGKQ